MTKTAELIQLSPDALHSLASGDLVGATASTSLALSPHFVDPQFRSIWIRRSRQIVGDPDCAEWITRVVVDAHNRLPVDGAGFHGPPDQNGMVEVGYAVDPAHQRLGYARAALEALRERANREQDVRTVRATISPDNAPSRNLVLQYGFAEVGEQWDDEDGLETIFEVGA